MKRLTYFSHLFFNKSFNIAFNTIIQHNHSSMKRLMKRQMIQQFIQHNHSTQSFTGEVPDEC